VRFARRVLAKLVGGGAADGSGAVGGGGARELVVAVDGSWFRPPASAAVRVGRAGPQRRIVNRLARSRIRQPGRPVSLDALVRAGWPDESILAGAAKNRLHVTIARLRKTGLEGLLLREADGYLLDPDVPVRVADEALV